MAQSTKVINGTEYSQIATKYGEMLAVLAGASSYLYDALHIIAEMDEVEPTRDLIVPFDNIYQQQSVALSAPSQFIEAARALNNHVLSRARDNAGAAYTDINDWFADQGDDGYAVSFPAEWATLSALAGQDVEDYID